MNESVKTTSMWNESYKVQCKSKALFEKWKQGKRKYYSIFLHAKPWIPGGEKSISRLLFTGEDRLCANLQERARTINEYDVTMLVRVTSQMNCGGVTMLSQKIPFLAIMAKWAIDDCF